MTLPLDPPTPEAAPPLKQRFDNLKVEPAVLPKGWANRRGYEFERLLNDAFHDADLDPTMSYKAEGEQIDGSLVLDHRVVLIEAKWTADELPASAIYTFKGKVDGKLVGTIGVMIAVNGFSEDAHNALRFGKDLNVLLMDGADLDVAFQHGMASAMRTKLRAAAEIGTAYYNLKPVRASVTTAQAKRQGNIRGSSGPRPLEFVVEGRSDAIIVQALAKRLLQGRGDFTIAVQIAGGKLNVPTIANGSWMESSLPLDAYARTRQIIVVDGDGDPEQTRAEMKKRLDRPADIIVIEPSIEQWFLDAGREMSVETMRRVARKTEALLELVGTFDLDLLRRQSPSFRDFENALNSSLKAPRAVNPS